MGAAVWSALLPVKTAIAFENALPDVTKYINGKDRNPGVQPKDLGLQVRKLNKFGDTSDGPVLKGCTYGPNCFSTTGDPEDPSIGTYIVPWKSPQGETPAEAATQLEQIIRDYPPGQNGADGGGFKLVTVADDYIYAQFESLKKGRIDDVEFAIDKGGLVQVRSSGRFDGKADYGSSAKRLIYISEKLRAKGWVAPEITKDSHPYYFSMNSGKTTSQCVGINCPVNYELVPEEICLNCLG